MVSKVSAYCECEIYGIEKLEAGDYAFFGNKSKDEVTILLLQTISKLVDKTASFDGLGIGETSFGLESKRREQSNIEKYQKGSKRINALNQLPDAESLIVGVSAQAFVPDDLARKNIESSSVDDETTYPVVSIRQYISTPNKAPLLPVSEIGNGNNQENRESSIPLRLPLLQGVETHGVMLANLSLSRNLKDEKGELVVNVDLPIDSKSDMIVRLNTPYWSFVETAVFLKYKELVDLFPEDRRNNLIELLNFVKAKDNEYPIINSYDLFNSNDRNKYRLFLATAIFSAHIY